MKPKASSANGRKVTCPDGSVRVVAGEAVFKVAIKANEVEEEDGAVDSVSSEDNHSAEDEAMEVMYMPLEISNNNHTNKLSIRNPQSPCLGLDLTPIRDTKANQVLDATMPLQTCKGTSRTLP